MQHTCQGVRPRRLPPEKPGLRLQARLGLEESHYGARGLLPAAFHAPPLPSRRPVQCRGGRRAGERQDHNGIQPRRSPWKPPPGCKESSHRLGFASLPPPPPGRGGGPDGAAGSPSCELPGCTKVLEVCTALNERHPQVSHHDALRCSGCLKFALMNTAFGSIPILFRHPSLYGLSRITNNLFISNGEAANNKIFIYANQITTIINVSVEVVNTYFPGIYYIHVPVMDNPSARLYNFFDAVADRIHAVELNQGRTLVHCAAGVSRSAALCMAYLMKYHSMSLADAHAWVRSCRPVIRPNIGFWRQLIQYERELFGKNSVRMIQTPLGVIPDLYENEVRFMIAL